MFAPEVRLHTFDAFLRQTKKAKALVAKMDIIRYRERIQLQCFDGNIVWTWSTSGVKDLAEFFGVELPEFRSMEPREDYDNYDWARIKFYQEYFEPHFQKLLETGYEEGYFTNLVMVAEELSEY